MIANSKDRWTGTLGWGLLVFIILVASFKLLNSLLFPWNYPRLSPIFAYLNGYEFYYPADRGPILNTLYPPLAYLVFFPSWLGRSPSQAVLIGACVSLLLYCLPVIAFFRKCRSGGLVIFALFLLFTFQIKGLYYSCCTIHADAPALGFSAIAVMLLADRKKALRSDACSALACALAILSKQTTLPLPIVLALFIFLTDGWRAALRFGLLFLVQLALFLLVLSAFIDFDAFLFNCLQIPSHHPWQDGKSISSLIKGLWVFFLHGQAIILFCLLVLFRADSRRPQDKVFVVGWLLLVVSLVLSRVFDMPTEDQVIRSTTNQWEAWEIAFLAWLAVFLGTTMILTASVARQLIAGLRARRSPRAFLRQNFHFLFLGLAMFELPMAILAYCKVGGYYNNFSLSLYFLLLFACSSLFLPGDSMRTLSASCRLKPVFLILGVLMLMSIRDLLLVPHAFSWVGNNLMERDFAVLRDRGDHVYFPWNPLGALMAHGKLYHFAYAIHDRDLAGVPPSSEHVRAHVPAGMSQIVFDLDPVYYTTDILKYFPEFIPSEDPLFARALVYKRE